MPPKKQASSLGKAIIKSRFRNNQRQINADGSIFHTTEIDDSWKAMQSVTQEDDLEAFLRTAQLAGTEFTAEKLNVKVITRQSHNPYLLTPEKEQLIRAQHETHSDKLTVPRRPPWTHDMSAEDLDRIEREAFLEWRRELAFLEEEHGLLLTPFEKNLQVWRQLWRVIERSDLIVQIVDARNPLFFRSVDLEKYIQEVDSNKRTMLLLNKADLLTEGQRRQWADYFDAQGVEYLFFSAALAVATPEQEEQDMEDMGPLDRLHILSAPELAHVLEHKCPRVENKKAAFGLVGYPNVGKSSTINALVGGKRVAVGATPGKTKHFQTIHLSDTVYLCDCPGLVFPTFASTQAEMVCNGVLPIDQMREYTGPVALVTQHIPQWFLESLYGIKIHIRPVEEGGIGIPTAEEFLVAYAAARGFTKSGQGNPDESRAARHVLKDYVNGKLLFNHPPPGVDDKAFNAEIYSEEYLETRFNKHKPVGEARQAHMVEERKVSNALVDDVLLQATQVATAGIKGKHGSGHGFTRLQQYPHQQRIGNDGRPLAVTTTGSSAIVEKKSKKHFKGRMGG